MWSQPPASVFKILRLLHLSLRSSLISFQKFLNLLISLNKGISAITLPGTLFFSSQIIHFIFFLSPLAYFTINIRVSTSKYVIESILGCFTISSTNKINAYLFSLAVCRLLELGQIT